MSTLDGPLVTPTLTVAHMGKQESRRLDSTLRLRVTITLLMAVLITDL